MGAVAALARHKSVSARLLFSAHIFFGFVHSIQFAISLVFLFCPLIEIIFLVSFCLGVGYILPDFVHAGFVCDTASWNLLTRE